MQSNFIKNKTFSSQLLLKRALLSRWSTCAVFSPMEFCKCTSVRIAVLTEALEAPALGLTLQQLNGLFKDLLKEPVYFSFDLR